MSRKNLYLHGLDDSKQFQFSQMSTERQKTLQEAQKPTQRQQYFGSAMEDITKYLEVTYFKKINEAELELQDLQNIAKSNKTFKQINPRSTISMANLLQITDKDNNFKEKGQLLENFPVDRERFQAQINYKYAIRQNEKKRKLISIAKPKSCVQLQSPKSILSTKDSTQIQPSSSRSYLLRTTQLPKKFRSLKGLLKEHCDSKGLDNNQAYIKKQMNFLGNDGIIDSISRSRF